MATIRVSDTGDATHQPSKPGTLTLTVDKIQGDLQLTKSVDGITAAQPYNLAKLIKVGTQFGNAVYQLDSNTAGMTLSGSTLDKATHEGEVKVSISDKGDATHTASPAQQFTLTVVKAENPMQLAAATTTYAGQDISLLGLGNIQAAQGPLSIVSVTPGSGDEPGTGSLNGHSLHVTQAGGFVVTVKAAGNNQYKPVTANFTLQVHKGVHQLPDFSASMGWTHWHQAISSFDYLNKVPDALGMVHADKLISAPAVCGSYCTVYDNNGVPYIQTNSTGTFKIQVSDAGSKLYQPGTATFTLTMTTVEHSIHVSDYSTVYQSDGIGIEALGQQILVAGHPLTVTGANHDVKVLEVTPDTGAGTYLDGKLMVSQAGTFRVKVQDAGWAGITPATTSFTLTVNKASHSFAVADVAQTYAEQPIPLAPLIKASGNLGAVTVTDVQDGSGQGSYQDGQLTVKKAGSFTVEVTDAGDDTHTPATTSFTLTVSKASHSFRVADVTQSYAEQPIPLAPLIKASGNLGAVTVTDVVDGSGQGGYQDGQLTVKKAGSFTVEVTDTGDDTHTAAKSQFTLTVIKALNPMKVADIGVTYAGSNVSLLELGNIRSNQGLLTVNSATPISGGDSAGHLVNKDQLEVVKAGKFVVTVTAAGNDQYKPSTESFTLTVNKGIHTLPDFSADLGWSRWHQEISSYSFLKAVPQALGAVHIDKLLSAPANCGTYCEVYDSDGLPRIKTNSLGIFKIQVSDEGNDLYKAGTATFTLTMTKIPHSFTVNDAQVTYTGQPITLAEHISGGQGAQPSFEPLSDIVKVIGVTFDGTGKGSYANGELTVKQAGTFTIQVQDKGWAGYEPVDSDFTLTVNKAAGVMQAKDQTRTLRANSQIDLSDPKGFAQVTNSHGKVTVTGVDGPGKFVDHILTVNSAGKFTVHLQDSGDGTHDASEDVTFVLTAEKTPAISLAVTPSEDSVKVGSGSYLLTNKLSVKQHYGALSYGLMSAGGTGSTLTGSSLSIGSSSGVVEIRVSDAGDGTHKPSTPAFFKLYLKEPGKMTVTGYPLYTYPAQKSYQLTASELKAHWTIANAYGTVSIDSIKPFTESGGDWDPSTQTLTVKKIGLFEVYLSDSGDSLHEPTHHVLAFIGVGRGKSQLSIADQKLSYGSGQFDLSNLDQITRVTNAVGKLAVTGVSGSSGNYRFDAASQKLTVFHPGVFTAQVHDPGDENHTGASTSFKLTVLGESHTITALPLTLDYMDGGISLANLTNVRGAIGKLQVTSIKGESGAGSFDVTSQTLSATRVGTFTVDVADSGEGKYEPASTSFTLTLKKAKGVMQAVDQSRHLDSKLQIDLSEPKSFAQVSHAYGEVTVTGVQGDGDYDGASHHLTANSVGEFRVSLHDSGDVLHQPSDTTFVLTAQKVLPGTLALKTTRGAMLADQSFKLNQITATNSYGELGYSIKDKGNTGIVYDEQTQTLSKPTATGTVSISVADSGDALHQASHPASFELAVNKTKSTFSVTSGKSATYSAVIGGVDISKLGAIDNIAGSLYFPGGMTQYGVKGYLDGNIFKVTSIDSGGGTLTVWVGDTGSATVQKAEPQKLYFYIHRADGTLQLNQSSDSILVSGKYNLSGLIKTGTSHGLVSYSISSDSAGMTLQGDTLDHASTTGSVVVRVRDSGSNLYNPSEQTFTLHVEPKHAGTLQLTKTSDKIIAGQSYPLSQLIKTGTAHGAVSYTLVSAQNSAGMTLTNEHMLTRAHSSGRVVVEIRDSGDASYLPSSSQTFILNVNKVANQISATAKSDLVVASGQPLNLTPTSVSQIASVSNAKGAVTITDVSGTNSSSWSITQAGKYTVTLHDSGTQWYAPSDYKLVIQVHSVTITFNTPLHAHNGFRSWPITANSDGSYNLNETNYYMYDANVAYRGDTSEKGTLKLQISSDRSFEHIVGNGTVDITPARSVTIPFKVYDRYGRTVYLRFFYKVGDISISSNVIEGHII
ncbi:hypothetical protein [Dongshaea marina]|uniref:hypothetical protein n=1 Tax=Dongshaea marina TaxID=2047966 RepID=UPI000D3EB2A0|nr:hypothetical protein [Dongshaea marina]